MYASEYNLFICSSLLKPKAMLPQVNQSEGGIVDVAVTHSPLSFSLTRLKSASVTVSQLECHVLLDGDIDLKNRFFISCCLEQLLLYVVESAEI